MDSLTQIVLGAAVGEAVLGKKVGNKAMLYGAIAGTIPDLDSFAPLFTDFITAIEIHRGFSHSLLFAILFAPIFGGLISRIERKSIATWKEWSWLMFWGLITHPLLDAHTTWGTQLFWPFDLRIAYKNIFVIDPLYTIPFLVFLILAMRSKRGSEKRRKYNNLGLIVSSIYMLITIGLKGLSYMKFQEALEEQDISYLQMQTRPSPFNTIMWSANIELHDAYLLGDYSFFDSQPIQFTRIPKNHELIDFIRTEDRIQRIIAISQGWYTISNRNGNIYLNDLRFGAVNLHEENPKFIFSYLLKTNSDNLEITEVPRDPEDATKLLSDLSSRVWGN
ncbi:metal-dependent hydrolase [Gillisia sp. M10.2A]|uniref:Metal-dependent hydrolase n=1 Tax=Gillisia lutea TaxID=2909668 RepID=A0ABS9EGD3_9FLAO|nr:metal-dependent hydrolase [Gillisia lutea]MCF4100830.1 metal-dependent hydrolase [Gillisia lutea]